jgi:hypothetical protein
MTRDTTHTREMRVAILAALAEGICTTEELRIAACDTMPVVYNVLRKMRAEGLIQSNRPRRLSDGYKWRLTPKTSTRAVA